MIPAILGTYWKVLKAFFLRPRTQQSNWILDSKCTDSLRCKFISLFSPGDLNANCMFFFSNCSGCWSAPHGKWFWSTNWHVWMENLVFYGCRWCVKIISSSSLCCLQSCSASCLTIYVNNIIVTKLETRNCNWLRAHSSSFF